MLNRMVDVSRHAGLDCGVSSIAGYTSSLCSGWDPLMPKMPYNGTEYWIGFHREYGLLLYDPGGPQAGSLHHVYLFDLSSAVFRPFVRDAVGSTRRHEPWLRVDEHRTKEMSRHVRWYDERKDEYRAFLRDNDRISVLKDAPALFREKISRRQIALQDAPVFL